MTKKITARNLCFENGAHQKQLLYFFGYAYPLCYRLDEVTDPVRENKDLIYHGFIYEINIFTDPDEKLNFEYDQFFINDPAPGNAERYFGVN